MRLIEKLIAYKTEDLFVGDAFIFKKKTGELLDLSVKDVVQLDKNGQYVSVVSKKIYSLNSNTVSENEVDVIANIKPYAEVVATSSKRTSKKDVLNFYHNTNKQFDKTEILVLNMDCKFWELKVLVCLNEYETNRKSYYVWSGGRISKKELCYQNDNQELVFADGVVTPLLDKHKLLKAFPDVMKKYKHRYLTQNELREISENVVSRTMTEETKL